MIRFASFVAAVFVSALAASALALAQYVAPEHHHAPSGHSVAPLSGDHAAPLPYQPAPLPYGPAPPIARPAPPIHDPALPAPSIRNTGPFERTGIVAPDHDGLRPPVVSLPLKPAIQEPALSTTLVTTPKRSAWRTRQWNDWPWNYIWPWSPISYCSGYGFWGKWGLLTTPSSSPDSPFYAQPFEIYSAYEFGPWGPAAAWEAAYGLPQSSCGFANFNVF